MYSLWKHISNKITLNEDIIYAQFRLTDNNDKQIFLNN